MKRFIATILLFSALMARAEWMPLPQLSASGQYYNVLLHLGADFYEDMLYESGVGNDQLVNFGGQANQAPYPGLTYSGLTGHGSGGQNRDFTWTIITNATANFGLWTTGVPGNTNGKDNYIKYWHIYINVPGDEARDARVYFRCDDDLRIWRNGELIASSVYTGSDIFAATTLHAGLNSITIKLREGSSGDNMGFRITDPNGAPFTDLDYSLNLKILAPSAPPLALARSHDSITVAPNFVNNSGKAFDLWAVCDSEERGDALSDWTNSPTCSVQMFPNIFAPPASIEFNGLQPATPHAIRLFATHDGDEWEASLTLNISTFDVCADITSLAATDIEGLAATANARINSYGVNENAADVYLFYWQEGAASTNTAFKPAQSIGPVEIEMTGLAYSTDYRYRFAASNVNGFAWSANTIAFKTLGDPKLGEPTAAMAGSGVVEMSVDVIESGAGAISATCYWGDSLDNMQPIETWADITGLSELSAQISGVSIGYPYYYAFEVHAFVDANTQWTVGVTNAFTTTGACVWTAGGADTDWHNADNWDLGVPGPAGTAEFVNIAGGPINVTASDYVQIDAINVRSGTSEVILDLGSALLKAENITTTVNNTKLTLASGRLEVFNFTVGRHSGAASSSYNEVTLEPGSHLKVANLVVGHCVSTYNGPLQTRFTVRAGAVLEADANTIITRREGDQDTNGAELLIQGLFLANGIHMNANRGGAPNGAFFTIDGGVVTNTSTTRLDGGTYQWMTLRNNARFIQTKDTLIIGQSASQIRLQVLDGSVFDLNGSVTMNDRGDNPGNTSWLIVSNATFRATGGNSIGHRGNNNGAGRENAILVYEDPGHETTVSFGGNIHFRSSRDNVIAINGGAFETTGTLACATENGGDLRNSYSNQFHIAGATTRLRSAALSLRNDALLRFDIPAEGFADTPFVVTGNASINNATLYPAANEPRDDNTRIEINVGDFIGRAALLAADTGNLDQLRPENIIVNLRPGRRHKLHLTPQAIAVDVWVEGTLIMVR